MDGKALGVLPMSRGFALILACGASLFSFGVQASPILFAPMQKAASDIILVWDWCGLGFHRDVYGYCIRNGTVVASCGRDSYGSGSVAYGSGSVARSSCASSSCPDRVPLRLLPWSLWPLPAALNASVGHLNAPLNKPAALRRTHAHRHSPLHRGFQHPCGSIDLGCLEPKCCCARSNVARRKLEADRPNRCADRELHWRSKGDGANRRQGA